MEKAKSNPTIAPASIAPSNASGSKPRVAPVEKGTLVKKKNVASGDPYTQAKPSRTRVKATSGARYGISVKFQQTTAPEAGAVQGNGRILPSAIKRQAPSFGAGMVDHN
jgi:hypothetical protein